jgi:4-hydroxybenzoyl-CoA thioesterase
MAFATSTQVRFGQVDAAGITFYPRYFEMLNDAVDDWFTQILGAGFRSMHVDRGIGVPTVRISAEFLSPSVLGDELEIRIVLTQIGRSSCAYDALFTADGTDRMKVSAVLVCMDLATRKSVCWPDDIRLRMMNELAPTA